MTKRKGLFDVGIHARGLLDDMSVWDLAASKPKTKMIKESDDSKQISDALDMK